MAEGKKKQKKSPWWYKLGILVFGAVFCVSAFMAGRDYLAAKKEADAFDSLSKLAADYAEEKAPADLPESSGETTDQEKAAEWAELLKEAAGYAALKNENPDYVGWIRIPLVTLVVSAWAPVSMTNSPSRTTIWSRLVAWLVAESMTLFEPTLVRVKNWSRRAPRR